MSLTSYRAAPPRDTDRVDIDLPWQEHKPKGQKNRHWFPQPFQRVEMLRGTGRSGICRFGCRLGDYLGFTDASLANLGTGSSRDMWAFKGRVRPTAPSAIAAFDGRAATMAATARSGVKFGCRRLEAVTSELPRSRRPFLAVMAPTLLLGAPARQNDRPGGPCRRRRPRPPHLPPTARETGRCPPQPACLGQGAPR